MSRGDGFQVADVDSSYMDDAKLRALWQRLRDPDQMARAVVLHQSTVLASWRHGDRVTVEDAVLFWLWPESQPDLIDALVAVRLLDAEHRIPKGAWSAWFGEAERKRARKRNWNRITDERRAGAARCDHAECRTHAREIAWEREPHVCWMCGVPVASGVNLHMDHVVPLARGGIHCADNLRPACGPCNTRKGARQ